MTDADDSTVSAIVLKPTQRPVKRDIAQPSRPMSRMSCTPAGLRTGIIAETNSSSEPCGSVEERQAWSSAASASTPPCFEVPAALPCLNTSPQRSTPGPLPYHMREHAIVLRAREQVGLLRAPDHRRAEVLVEAGLNSIADGLQVLLRLPQFQVEAAERRAAIAGDETGRCSCPAARSRSCCISGRRTSACTPDR